MLMLVCTATGRLIDTGATYTRDDLLYAKRAKLILRCPFCRQCHLFHFSDARLVPGPASPETGRPAGSPQAPGQRLLSHAPRPAGKAARLSGQAPNPAGRSEWLTEFLNHADEMSDGDEIIIRKAEGRFVVLTMSGAYVNTGFGADIREAWETGDGPALPKGEPK
jgi:hypothetical protein